MLLEKEEMLQQVHLHWKVNRTISKNNTKINTNFFSPLKKGIPNF